MVVLVWFLIVESVVFLLILQVKPIVKFNVNLTKQKAIFALKIFNIMPLIFKIEKEKKRFRLSINGKIIGKDKKRKRLKSKPTRTPSNLTLLIKEVAMLVEKIDCVGIWEDW